MDKDIGPEGVKSLPDRPFGIVAGGSFGQALAAAAAAVLAIIGLAGGLVFYALTIGTICLGAGFLLQGSSLASQYAKLVARAGDDDETRPALGSGLTALSVSGIAAIALGVLALIGIAPTVLVPVAIIGCSIGLMLESAAVVDLATLSYRARADEVSRIAGGSAILSGGAELLVGIAGAALGVLALVGIEPLTLSLVAILALGASAFLTGTALGTRLARSAARRK